MDILIFLIPISLFFGSVGLGAFLFYVPCNTTILLETPSVFYQEPGIKIQNLTRRNRRAFDIASA